MTKGARATNDRLYGLAFRILAVDPRRSERCCPQIARESLAKVAKADGARRIRVQVGIGYVDYTPPEALNGSAFTHVGPDWREPRFEQFPSPDPDDAEQQACAGA